MREHKHRLSNVHYRGFLSASFTLCIRNRIELFTDDAVVARFTDTLLSVVDGSGCIVPAYCFMPDHQHVVLSGVHEGSDLRKTVIAYKQKTGYWLSQKRPDVKWQKDFYDHIIRSGENLATHVRYILDNPVRKGLATSWQDYPYKGSVGCSLDEVLNSLV